MIQSSITDKNWDRVIIGAGVVGLWHARHAIKRGERVLVLEKRTVGAGASGGFLGSLMPHMPDNWNEKKQFQYEGLLTIADAITGLEADTGLDCGFRRCGRIMPLRNENMSAITAARMEGSKKRWSESFSMHVYSDPKASQLPGGWVDEEHAPFGLVHDTLSARVDPRLYLEALNSYVAANGRLVEGAGVHNLDPQTGTVSLETGKVVKGGMLVVANGWEAYPLLQPFLDGINNGEPIGRGVKGQAVLVEYAHEDDLPIVYDDGVYVVPHAGNRVAIGSTSVNDWYSGDNPTPDRFDSTNMEFYEKAIRLVPALWEAPIVSRWASVRPRNTLKGRGTSPWFGPVPGHDNLIALIGGFKITFGIAHLDRDFT